MEYEKPIEVILEEIKSAKANVEVSEFVGETHWVKITLPYGCYVKAYEEPSIKPEPGVWEIAWIEVPEEFRGNNIASRLLKNLVSKIKEFGGTRLIGWTDMPEAVKARTKVFGIENTKTFIIGNKNIGIKDREFPVEVAISEETKPPGQILVENDIKDLDVAEWEKPEEVKQEK